MVGEPVEASRVLTIIGPTVITLWAAMGILMIRSSDVPKPAAGAYPRWQTHVLG